MTTAQDLFNYVLDGCAKSALNTIEILGVLRLAEDYVITNAKNQSAPEDQEDGENNAEVLRKAEQAARGPIPPPPPPPSNLPPHLQPNNAGEV